MHIFHISKSKYISEVVSFQFFGGKKLIVTRGQMQWVKYLTRKPRLQAQVSDHAKIILPDPLQWFDVWHWASFKEVKAFHISVINKSIPRRSRPRKCSFRMMFSKEPLMGTFLVSGRNMDVCFPQKHTPIQD